MKLLTVKELSEQLRIKPGTLYALAAQGKIPHLKIGRLVRFSQEDIDLWLASKRQEESQSQIHLAPPEGKPLDIDAIVRNAIDSVKGTRYNPRNGRPDRIGEGGERKGRHGAV